MATTIIDKWNIFLTGMYKTNVARNLVEGHKVIHLFGRNEDIDTGDQQEISDQGETRNYIEVATQFYISSSSASDTSITYLISGVDSDWNEATATVTVNGQSQVAISNANMMHVNTMQGISANSSVGTIYLAESDTLTNGVPDTAGKIQLQIGFTGSQNNNITRALFYSVPAGYTSYLQMARVFTGKNKDADIFFHIKPFGLAEIIPSGFDIYQTAVEFDVNPQIELPEKTFIRVTGSSLNNNTEMGIGIELIQIKN